MELTSIVLVVVVCIIVILAILSGTQTEIKFLNFFLRLNKQKSIGDKIIQIIHITRCFTEQIERAKSSIYSQQMNYAEGALISLRKSSDIDLKSLDSLKLLIKISLRENGFDKLDTVQFSRYVGDQIDKYRDYLSANCDTFKETTEFRDVVAHIYNNARMIDDTQKIEIDKLEKEMETNINKVVKVL
jgi:hypothetical protein